MRGKGFGRSRAKAWPFCVEVALWHMGFGIGLNFFLLAVSLYVAPSSASVSAMQLVICVVLQNCDSSVRGVHKEVEQGFCSLLRITK